MISLQKNNKVILLDFGIFLFKSIFAWKNRKEIPPTYTALMMIIACLKKVKVHPDDLIILAVDSPKGSWRKKEDPQYKANRKELREKEVEINWKEMFQMFDRLIENLKISSPFHIVRIDYFEADDIIAGACKLFSENEVVIISSDSDYEQLVAYPNVKVFSPKSKKYKIIKDPYKILASKIEKEKSDNLLAPILTEADYNRRLRLVDLIHLPQEIELEVVKQLSSLKEKDYDLTLFPFKNSLQKRFMTIYNEQERKKNEDYSVF